MNEILYCSWSFILFNIVINYYFKLTNINIIILYFALERQFFLQLFTTIIVVIRETTTHLL